MSSSPSHLKTFTEDNKTQVVRLADENCARDDELSAAEEAVLMVGVDGRGTRAVERPRLRVAAVI